MPKTYDPIEAITLTSNQASITFNSIPGTFTDLIIVYNGQADGSMVKRIKFNGDNGSANYSCTMILGDGASAVSGRYSESWLDVANAGTNRAMTIVQVMNYANSTTNKTYLSRQASAAVSTEAIVGLWRNTAAITTIRIEGSANNFVSGSTFTLYGIKAA